MNLLNTMDQKQATALINKEAERVRPHLFALANKTIQLPSVAKFSETTVLQSLEKIAELGEGALLAFADKFNEEECTFLAKVGNLDIDSLLNPMQTAQMIRKQRKEREHTDVVKHLQNGVSNDELALQVSYDKGMAVQKHIIEGLVSTPLAERKAYMKNINEKRVELKATLNPSDDDDLFEESINESTTDSTDNDDLFDDDGASEASATEEEPLCQEDQTEEAEEENKDDDDDMFAA